MLDMFLPLVFIQDIFLPDVFIQFIISEKFIPALWPIEEPLDDWEFVFVLKMFTELAELEFAVLLSVDTESSELLSAALTLDTVMKHINNNILINYFFDIIYLHNYFD